MVGAREPGEGSAGAVVEVWDGGGGAVEGSESARGVSARLEVVAVGTCLRAEERLVGGR